MIRTGVVTALDVEARTLGRTSAQRGQPVGTLGDGTLVAVSGMGGSAAAAAASALVTAGAEVLVSWGLAGGLDPSLRAGTVCLPTLVVSADGPAFAVDPVAHDVLHRAAVSQCRVVAGRLLTTAKPITDVAGKRAAFAATAAVAVDMESVAIAAVAAEHHLPFAAVRVIVDAATDSLPDAVLAAGGGGVGGLLRLVAGLARSPQDIAAVLRLARRYRAASVALVAVARTQALGRLA